jgi:hypothetical protein
MRRLLGVSVLIAAAACSDGSIPIVPRVDHDAGNGADADVRVPAPAEPFCLPSPTPTRVDSASFTRGAVRQALRAKPRRCFFKQICGGFRPNIADLAGLVDSLD